MSGCSIGLDLAVCIFSATVCRMKREWKVNGLALIGLHFERSALVNGVWMFAAALTFAFGLAVPFAADAGASTDAAKSETPQDSRASAAKAKSRDATASAIAETLSSAPQDRLGDHNELRQELASVKLDYRHWGLSRETKEYGTISDAANEDRGSSIDWSKQIPARTMKDLFLRSGPKFRAQRSAPSRQRMVFSYDGQLARVRDTWQLHNGPLSQLQAVVEENLSPELPHSAIISSLYMPDIGWLFGAGIAPKSYPLAEILGSPTIGNRDYRGHSCWEITWKAAFNEERDTLVRCEMLLARDRALLPILQVYRTGVSRSKEEVRRIEIDEFRRDPAGGLWFPKSVTATRRYLSDLDVAKITFKPDNQFKTATVFSDATPVLDRHRKPPPVVTSTFAPAPILDQVPSLSLSNWSVRQTGHTKLAGSGAVAFFAAAIAISLCLRVTRLGKLLRNFARDHRVLLGTGGLVCSCAVAALCSYPPGWLNYGLTMLITGLFGCVWIAFTMVLLGEKQVSLRLTLFAAAFAAIAFGGYSQGVKRMTARQRMISEVRSEGGHVQMGNWRLDEDGLYLPAPMRRVLGEAWTGRANRAAVPQELFTSKNLKRWCLDEVQWLGVASRSDASYDVDARILSELDDSPSLWTLHLEGGYLGPEAMVQLARFDKLIDLHFDCQYRPLAKEITSIPELERVWLTAAVINDDLIDSLNGIEHLDYVTFIKPKFERCDASRLQAKLQGVDVRFADVTPVALETLGQLATKLHFVDCSIKLPRIEPIAMPQTTGLSFNDCDLTNAQLAKLADADSLDWVRLARTRVSVDGVESYSQSRPDVTLSME